MTSYTLCPLHQFHSVSSCRNAWHSFVQNAEEKANCVVCICINPTPYVCILHPILHPKSSVNTGHPVPWCRKCRRFSKTFFIGGGGWKRCNGPETAKHRTSLSKSTDVLPQKYGCFHQRSPMFLFSESSFPQFSLDLLSHSEAINFPRFLICQNWALPTFR